MDSGVPKLLLNKLHLESMKNSAADLGVKVQPLEDRNTAIKLSDITLVIIDGHMTSQNLSPTTGT